MNVDGDNLIGAGFDVVIAVSIHISKFNVDGHKTPSVIRLLDTTPANQQFRMQRALKLGALGFENWPDPLN